MTTIPLLFALLMANSMGDRLVSDELGVSLDLPPNPTIVQRPGEGGSHFLIRDGRATPTWSLRIESQEVTGATAAACLRAVLKERLPNRPLADSEIVGTVGQDGRPVASIWFTESTQAGQDVTLGWLVAPQTLGRCLILSAVRTADSDRGEALAATFGSVRLLDRANDDADLGSALQAGKIFLKSITESDLRSLVGQGDVLRIYNPNAENYGELAFGTLQVEAAPRSAVRGRSAGKTPADQEEGLLVTSHLRFVENPDTHTYSDRVQRCWVSWDLEREIWVDSVTRRVSDTPTVQEEIVVRAPATLGVPRGQLLVIRQDDTHGTRNTWTLVPQDPWLPRALRWLVWDLPTDSPPDHVAWHVWDESTSTPRVTNRRDSWDPTLPGRRCWSWSGTDGLPTALSFDTAGVWTRATRPGGTVIEVSDRDTVTNRWEAAGLKMR